MLKTIIAKYKYYRDLAFLKKHGCKNWEEYNHRYDPDINIGASIVKDYYHGYPYVYCFEDPKHEIYFWDLGYDGTFVVNKWCKENLKGKFRFDFHRVQKASWSSSNQWEINELFGGDLIFFACKDPKDYTWLLLRWS
jgi:hypothetical protein